MFSNIRFGKRFIAPLLSSVQRLPNLSSPISRCICDGTILRLDIHEKERKRFAARIPDIDAFWLRIFEKQDEGVVYEEDLKTVWFLAEAEHVPLAIQLTEKYLQDAKSLFGSFKFSSVMARTFHLLNRPDLALQVLKNPLISKNLDDATSMIVLLDLLIKAEQYTEAINVYEWLVEMEWFFVVRHPIIPILYSVALYKQASPETLEKASKLVKGVGHRKYKQRVLDNVAALAIKLKEPSVAVSVITETDKISEWSWNMKLQANILLNKLDLVYRDINKMIKVHHLYEDTAKLLQAADPQQFKNLQHRPTKKRIEDEVMSPLKYEDFKSALAAPKKRFYM